MTQQQNGSLVAREMLWMYHGVSEEEVEKDFFLALEKPVTDEITRRIYQKKVWVGREMELTVGAYTVRARLTNIEPLLAKTTDANTRVMAKYRERAKDEGQDTHTFLSEIIRYPNQRLREVFQSLVGIDAIKDDMFRKLFLVLFPQNIKSWIKDNYSDGSMQNLANGLLNRYPLIILEGEVGCGKTALARSFGQELAREYKSQLAMFVVNAQVRGGGHVGELAQNISRAFTEAERCQEREQIPVLLLIDEADALAQARGGRQTHHEDDAGVNTLIQCIDRLRGRPMAVIFATNLIQSLDSAILRRAVALYHFDRPDPQQRTALFQRLLSGLRITEAQMEKLVRLTESQELPDFGSIKHRYTYSDIAQRIVPYAVEEAIFLQKPLSINHVLKACQVINPTPEMHTPQEEV